MRTWAIDPAIGMLLRLQAQARFRRMATRLLQPRRMVLTGLATVLAGVWIANATVSVLMRESAGTESFRGYIALALSSYAVWHVVRVACFRPPQPLEATDEVQAILAACPLRSQDLVAYHLVSAFSAALLKAACVTLLLLPDLPHPLLGLLGVLFALWTVDLGRIALEIMAWGMPRRAYLAYRSLVLSAVAAGCYLAAGTIRNATVAALAAASEENPLQSVHVFFSHVQDAGVVTGCRTFWHWILELIAAEQVGQASLGWIGLATAILATLMWGVLRIHQSLVSSVASQQRKQFQRSGASRGAARQSPTKVAERNSRRPLPQPVQLGGTGPLAWRQLLGASRYAAGLLSAMSVPGALSLIPLFAPVSAEGAFLSVAGGLAFYSFVLLPTALRFDFRRDVERLAMLKAYPIGNLAVATGQVAAPVIVTSTFQLVVLSIAQMVCPVAPGLMVGTMLMLVVLDMLIFSFENLIFLWYPHRLQQEGLEVLLRTTLTFTAKGVLFLLALAAIVVWSVPARLTADALTRMTGLPVSGYVVFFAGIVLLLAALSAGFLTLLARAFGNFDLVEDQPL